MNYLVILFRITVYRDHVSIVDPRKSQHILLGIQEHWWPIKENSLYDKFLVKANIYPIFWKNLNTSYFGYRPHQCSIYTHQLLMIYLVGFIEHYPYFIFIPMYCFYRSPESSGINWCYKKFGSKIPLSLSQYIQLI